MYTSTYTNIYTLPETNIALENRLSQNESTEVQ